MQDVPWFKWAHSTARSDQQRQCAAFDKLRFLQKGGGKGVLAAVEVRCSACGVGRNLEGITATNTMASIGAKCFGKQPWQRRDAESSCDADLSVLQRGASNIYYPKVVSALDISAGARQAGIEEEIIANRHFDTLELVYNSAEGVSEAVRKIARKIAEEAGCTIEKVLEVVGEETNCDQNTEVDDAELIREEWPVLTNPPEDLSLDGNFYAEVCPINNSQYLGFFKGLIEKVVLVKKLREVRALRGFERVTPGNGIVQADLGANPKNWLPAVEVFGEGIFLSFEEGGISKWLEEGGESLKERSDSVVDRWSSTPLDFLPEPTPRFLLLHTLAHLLIRQLTFDCGYSGSSLRERVYSAEQTSGSGPMAGILIYTADADSEGSLGGLVRQGYPDRLVSTLVSALRRASWCSSDPICRELAGQGLRGLNRAACHACSLVSETSCTYCNALLDRTFVVGESGLDGFNGYFHKLIAEGSTAEG
jgi:hypothetical protein